MTLKQIQELNEKFQNSAVQLSELIPSGTLVQATSMVVRSTRQIHTLFTSMLSAPSDIKFHQAMDKMEEEMDEVIFVLDQLEVANKKQQISLIQDFLKDGYNLVSVYSKCIDFVLDQKVQKED